MNTTYEEEEAAATPLISTSGIPTVTPDNRQPHEKKLALNIILASTLFERVAFYSLMSNIAFNLETEKIGSNSPNASIATFLFSGISYVSTLIFAVISDWKLGRAKTILVGFFIYLLGYASAVLITIPEVSNCTSIIYTEATSSQINSKCQEECRIWIRITFIVIAIGVGAVQSNMAVFGAEQIQKSKISSGYFDKYVIALNISSIFAVIVMRFLYEADNGYRIPSIVAASMLLIAALLFVIGWRYYIHVNLNETVITNCIPVYRNAFQTWRQYERNVHAIRQQQLNGALSDSISISDSLDEDDQEPIRIVERPSKFLDFAKAAYHGKFNDRIVDDVKSLRKALIVFSLLIPYWLIYSQLSATFSIQAKYMYMNGKVTSDMVAYIWLGDPVTIIIGILILNMFVYKYLDGRNRSLTITNKLVVGMCFASLSMCIAGIVEVFRQQGCDQDYGLNQSNLTIFYQLPQNIFMGFSEMFAMVASFEYAYYAAPRSAQTLFMSLRFCSLGISSFIATGYFAIFSKISSGFHFSCPSISNSQWSYYTYFLILAGLQFMFIFIFIVCQKKYGIIKLNSQQIEINQFQHSFSTSANN